MQLAGLPAARDAVREGTPVAYWRAGITQTASPSGGLEPAAGATREDVLRAAYAAAEAEIDPVDRALLAAASSRP